MTDSEVPTEILSSLRNIEAEFSQAESELLKQQVKLFTPLYEKRDPLTRKLPKFWSIVFEESDELSELIGVEDQELLSHLVELKVRRHEDEPRDFTITMEFEKDNGYLQNSSLVLKKSFVGVNPSESHDGSEVSSTPVAIEWLPKKDLTKDTSGRPSFFTFFAWTGSEGDVFREGEEVALILADQLYPEALKTWTDSQEIDSDEGSVDIDSEEESEGENEGPASKKQRVEK